MKQVVRIILAAAAVAALAVPAMAADKLIVKNAAGTADVFKVDDAGTVLGAKLGMGTTDPKAPLHLNMLTAAGASVPAGTSLYPGAAGIALSREAGTPSIDIIASDNTGNSGYRGMLRGVRSRGTLASPTFPSLNDQVFSVIGGIWTGARIYNTADITIKVDGPINDSGLVADPTGASVSAPARITFSTRNGLVWSERMTIKSGGNVGINTPDPKSILHVTGLVTYTSNANALSAGLTAGAFYTDGAGNVKVVY